MLGKEINNIEAEQNILGCFLVNNKTYFEVMGKIKVEYFCDPVHQDIFKAIEKRLKNDSLVSPVVLKDVFESHDGLNELGGGAYLARLAGAAIGFNAIGGYVKLIKGIYQKRQLQTILQDSINALVADDVSAGEVVGKIEASLLDTENEGGGLVSMMAATFKAAELASVAHRSDGIIGVTSGLVDLDAMTGGLQGGELVLLGGRPSMGKAQPCSSLVKTLLGWKRMGDLVVGEELASVDGLKSVVSGIFPQGQRRVAKVTFMDGRQVRCDFDHLWAVDSSRFKGRQVKTTSEIQALLKTKRYQGRLSVPLHTGDFGGGSVIIDPWLLGFLIGDGSLTCGVRFSTPDAQCLFKVQSAVRPLSVSFLGNYDYSITTPRGQKNTLWDNLKILGLAGKRSDNKFIPKKYLSASKQVRMDLLRGLMDSDGWVEKFGAVRYASSSLQLAKDVQELVWSIGGVCSISKKPTTHLDSYVLNIRCNEPSEIITLVRKKRRANRTKSVVNTIRSIVDDGVDECQCISVTHPESLYLTDGYVATHNTAVAMSMALDAARSGKGVVISSLEMTPDSLALRAITNEANRNGNLVAYTDAKKGTMSEDGARHFFGAAQAVGGLPIEILPSNIRDMGGIYAGVKKAQRVLAGKGTPLALIVIDYLQLIGGMSGNRFEKIAEISIALKALAMKTNIPVIALSQLSRALESRDLNNRRPMLSDLRESGQLEQDADMVLFCYRHEYYLSRETPDEYDIEACVAHRAALESSEGKMEIIVAKQRMGDIGTVHVGFNPATNFLWDVDNSGYKTAEKGLTMKTQQVVK